MSAPDPPTRLSLREMRSDALYRLLRSPRGRTVATLEDIPRMADLFSWPRIQIDVAIADLVADGKLSDGPDGKLKVARR